MAIGIPASFRAGNTLDFTISGAEYPAPDWSVRIDLVMLGKLVTLSSTDDGADHNVLISAATTAGYTSGVYSFAAYFDKGSGAQLERVEFQSGTIEVLPSFALATTGLDNRSTTRKIVDSLRALISGDVSLLVYSRKQLGDMGLECNPEGIFNTLAIWEGKLAAETAAETTGTESTYAGRRMVTRFSRW
jgi:hypothetical protein